MILSLWYRGRTYLLRRTSGGRAQRIQDAILDGIAVQEFEARYKDFDSKYTDLAPWLQKCILRFLSYRLDMLPRSSRVLDLGCGSGYFLLVCRHFGYEPVGLDLDNDEFFNDVVEYLSLNRVIHMIEPLEPLPRIDGGPFDAVTAFMTCFNRYSDGAPWQRDEWSYFIDDLAAQMRPGGKLIVKFNRNHKINRPFPPTLPNDLRVSCKQQLLFFADTMIVHF